MKIEKIKSAKVEEITKHGFTPNESSRYGFCWFLWLPKLAWWGKSWDVAGGVSVNWLCYRFQLTW